MLLAIIILMVMGGLIAYGGDYLGLKLGKKRLSLLGLRPRSTASLVGVALGALTALLTFLVLLALDRSFRIAVQRGAELVESNYHLTKDNHALRAQSAAAQAATARAQAAAGPVSTSGCPGANGRASGSCRRRAGFGPAYCGN